MMLNISKKHLIFTLPVVILSAIPPLTQLVFIYYYAHNLPVWEQWEFASKFELLFAGQNWVGSIFTPYNGHVLTFPFFISLIFGALSGWNTLFEIYVGWGLLLAVYLFYIVWLWRMGRLMLLTFMPVISILLFSLRSSEVILNSFDTTIYYTTALLVLITMNLASREKVNLLTLGGGIISAVLVSFSWGAGLMVWPAAGLILLFREKGWAKIRNIAIWLLAGGSIYYSISQLSKTPPLPQITLEWLAGFISFVSAVLGNPFIKPTATEANHIFFLVIGLVLLLTVGLYWKIDYNPFGRLTAPWVGVGIYTLLNAPLIALTRSGNPANAMLSRYSIVLVPVVITLLVLFGYGVYQFLLKKSSTSPSKNLLWLAPIGLAICFITPSMTASYLTYQLIKGWSPRIIAMVNFVNTYPNLVTSGQFLGLVYLGDDRLVEADLQLMRTYHLAAFKHNHDPQLETILKQDRGQNQEQIQTALERISLDNRGFAIIEGWAADIAKTQPMPIVLLLDRNGLIETATTGILRPDIAAQFQNEQLLSAGWEFRISTRKLEQITFPVQIRFVNNNLVKIIEFTDLTTLKTSLEPVTSGLKN